MNKVELLEEVNEIVNKIIEGYNPEKIILFGSYAYGKPAFDSDIDMLIIKKTSDDRITRYCEVKKIAFDRNRHVSFDPLIMTPNEIERRQVRGDDFINEILSRGIVLYEKQLRTQR